MVVADGPLRVGKEHSNFWEARSATNKFHRKLNRCCGTEVQTFRSVGRRRCKAECLWNT